MGRTMTFNATYKSLLSTLTTLIFLTGCASTEKEINRTTDLNKLLNESQAAMENLVATNSRLSDQLLLSDKMLKASDVNIKNLQRQLNDFQWSNSTLNNNLVKARRTIDELTRLNNEKSLKSLSITDNFGNTRIKLFVDEENVTRIRMYRSNGELTNSIFSYPLEFQDGVAGFTLTNSDRKNLVSMNSSPNNFSRFYISDNDGKTRILNQYLYDKDVSEMYLYGEDEQSQIGFSGFENGDVLYRAFDSSGNLRILDGVNSSYDSFRLNYHTDGKILDGILIPYEKSDFKSYTYSQPSQILWDVISAFSTLKTLRSR